MVDWGTIINGLIDGVGAILTAFAQVLTDNASAIAGLVIGIGMGMAVVGFGKKVMKMLYGMVNEISGEDKPST